jgi:hypothetical protein
MSQHTPGPWAVDSTKSFYVFGPARLSEQAGPFICNASTQANARLISAAPDLLDALRALMALDVKGHALADRLQFSDSGRALLDQCCAAIEKAKQ